MALQSLRELCRFRMHLTDIKNLTCHRLQYEPGLQVTEATEQRISRSCRNVDFNVQSVLHCGRNYIVRIKDGTGGSTFLLWLYYSLSDFLWGTR
jgi:hypothetical protein